MNPEFWHSRWAENRIGFHLTDINPLLVEYWPTLKPQRNERVLVPMCGKSNDLVWLAERHNQVVGIELSDIAVKAFFAENLYTPLVTGVGHQLTYEFDEITIHCGDFFATQPFSVDQQEIEQLFSGCKVSRLARDEGDENHPRIKQGVSRFAEEVWLIER